MPNNTIVSVDLHDAEPEGRKAFNDTLRGLGWTRYAEYSPGDKRRLPYTVWLTNLTTELAIKNALREAVNAGNKKQDAELSIRRAVASPYSKIFFVSPQNEIQPLSERLAEFAANAKLQH